MRDVAAVHQRDRYGVRRIAVREVGAAVDGIDEPAIAATLTGAGDLPGFLAEDRVIGKGTADRRHERIGNLHVGAGGDLGVFA